jgi:hypothetical protein
MPKGSIVPILKVRKSLELPLELALKIEHAAQARNESESAFIRAVLTQYFAVIPVPKKTVPKPNSLADEWAELRESTGLGEEDC